MSDRAMVPRIWEGHEIEQRESDAYLNATAMCKACDKDWSNYSQNKSTNEFLHALASDLGIPRSHLVQIKRGVTQGTSPKDQGTWVHPQVAIHLAQWLSPEFAVQVSKWVHELLLKGSVGTGMMTASDVRAIVAQTLEQTHRQQLFPRDQHPWDGPALRTLNELLSEWGWMNPTARQKQRIRTVAIRRINTEGLPAPVPFTDARGSELQFHIDCWWVVLKAIKTVWDESQDDDDQPPLFVGQGI